jgi:hypothetical protein
VGNARGEVPRGISISRGPEEEWGGPSGELNKSPRIEPKALRLGLCRTLIASRRGLHPFVAAQESTRSSALAASSGTSAGVRAEKRARGAKGPDGPGPGLRKQSLRY